MPFILFFVTLLTFDTFTPNNGKTEQIISDQVYMGVDHIISLSKSTADIKPELLSDLINFVSSTPPDLGSPLRERNDAQGAFYKFAIQGDLSRILDYVYNPNIPCYVAMPSSLHLQEWVTPETLLELENLPKKLEARGVPYVLRGRDRETITPDTNTGAYYKYDQDRLVVSLPGPRGPVLVSVSSQTNKSEVGKKGCVAGDDKNWSYLYSDKVGLSKAGLGWVSSYMYYAESMIIYVVDSLSGVIHIGIFKWLDAGWASMNMVNSNHILTGIKRFASDFTRVLESPDLPAPTIIAAKYRQFQESSKQSLQQAVLPYLQSLVSSGTSGECSGQFNTLLSSGEYLQKMSHEEMVKILMLEYLKESIREQPTIKPATKLQGQRIIYK
jgi:hypothetical protein